MEIEYGLIGENLQHSFSREIHEMFASYDYQLIRIPKSEIHSFLSARRFRGLNVTIPYKKTAMTYCDKLTDAAAAIGSVNTLTIQPDGSMLGDNTDWLGLSYLVQKAGISLTHQKVLILGSGGTGLTAAYTAKQLGASNVVTVSRRGAINYDTVYNLSDSSVIINTTPVGMYPCNEESPLDLSRFPNLSGVIDVIYNPLRTRLIQQAATLHIPCSGGLPMLVAQAKYSSQQFARQDIPDTRIEEVFHILEKKLTNIVLIGMPGSGKTTVGKLLAEQTGRPFVDSDAEIESFAGMSIPAIFQVYGEAYFRELETQILQKIGTQTGLVIASGGGSVLRQENVVALRQNGILFELYRPIRELPVCGRPLSQNRNALQEMEKKRAPIYAACRDERIENTLSPENAVTQIKEKFDEAFCH